MSENIPQQPDQQQLAYGQLTEAEVATYNQVFEHLNEQEMDPGVAELHAKIGQMVAEEGKTFALVTTVNEKTGQTEASHYISLGEDFGTKIRERNQEAFGLPTPTEGLQHLQAQATEQSESDSEQQEIDAQTLLAMGAEQAVKVAQETNNRTAQEVIEQVSALTQNYNAITEAAQNQPYFTALRDELPQATAIVSRLKNALAYREPIDEQDVYAMRRLSDFVDTYGRAVNGAAASAEDSYSLARRGQMATETTSDDLRRGTDRVQVATTETLANPDTTQELTNNNMGESVALYTAEIENADEAKRAMRSTEEDTAILTVQLNNARDQLNELPHPNAMNGSVDYAQSALRTALMDPSRISLAYEAMEELEMQLLRATRNLDEVETAQKKPAELAASIAMQMQKITELPLFERVR